jgi:hypothetical protein
MSADNWTTCPRCTKAHEAAIDKREKAVADSYGKVPVEEFDRARQEVDSLKATRLDVTFREDYEIYGAEDGEVTVAYSGRCSQCGLGVKFSHVHPLDVDGSS